MKKKAMKKKWMKWSAVCAVLLVAVCLFALWPREGSQGVFYRISGGKNELYLLGSIHVGSKEMYPFNRSIRDAIGKADVMVFECDAESDQSVDDTMAMMKYPEGESLADSVSAETLEKLDQAALRMGYDAQGLRALKPWAVTSMLSVQNVSSAMDARSAEQSAALGVEKQVMKQSEKKERLYLETIPEQLGRMDAFSPALQEYILADACDAVLNPEPDDELKQWPEWWVKGDAEAFAASYRKGQAEDEQPLLAEEYHLSLITQRNQQMAERLAALLENDEGKTYFATVGLMHLVLEEDSILSELKAMGYTVEKIEK